MLADEFLPDPDARLLRSTIVDAAQAPTYEAIRSARLLEDNVLGVLDRLRYTGERVFAMLGGDEPHGPTTVGDLLTAEGCIPLAEDEGRELVVGAVGRLWNPTEAPRTDVDAEAFRSFAEPGYAKGLVTFGLHPRGEERTLLTLEARATAPKGTRSRLQGFGHLAKPAAGLFASRVLAAIAAEAEPVRAPSGRPAVEVQARDGEVATLDDVDVRGRRVLLRVDVNSPIIEGRIGGRQRLEAAARSVQALLARGAGVAVIAHQGRPGGEDFTDLSEHAAILAELLDREVDHVEDVEGSAALDAVEQLQPEQVLVLGNVRASEGETQSADPGTHGRRAWVRRLGQRADVYVNDAFPACHRAHASIVGFPARMPAVAGPGLVDELEALTAIGERDPPRVAVLGGAKAGKSLELVGHQLARDRVDEVCLGGLLAVPFLAAEGVEIGEGTQALLGEDAAVYRRRARTLLDGHADRIQLPEDVAVRRDGDRFEVPVDELADGRIRDIGTDTANSFADRLSEAETLLVHGPMGVYEEARFARGTRRVFAQAAETSGYKVVGGGHTVHALEDLGIDRSGFDHVSLAGGALLSHLAGEELPGLAALKGSPRQRVH